MNEAVIGRLRGELAGLREQGLYKTERVLASPQGGVVRAGDRDVINLCANNYLGLANHPAVRAAAQRAIEQHGYGMASVRFICGTPPASWEPPAAALPSTAGSPSGSTYSPAPSARPWAAAPEAMWPRLASS